MVEVSSMEHKSCKLRSCRCLRHARKLGQGATRQCSKQKVCIWLLTRRATYLLKQEDFTIGVHVSRCRYKPHRHTLYRSDSQGLVTLRTVAAAMPHLEASAKPHAEDSTQCRLRARPLLRMHPPILYQSFSGYRCSIRFRSLFNRYDRHVSRHGLLQAA